MPIPAIIQHGVSEQQSRAYAEQITTAVNKLLGKLLSLNLFAIGSHWQIVTDLQVLQGE